METRVRGPSPEPAAGQQNVEVCCRVRPERAEVPQVEIRCDSREVKLCKVDGVCDHSTFAFDKVFPATTSQADVYDQSARPVIEAILEGFNGTVLAYGPTASGKTYTMEGELGDAQNQGIIPRMVWTIFDGIHAAPAHVEFTVKVSIVEIYNDKIRDLLVPCARRPRSDGGQNLKVHEDPFRGIYVGDCTEIYVAQEQDVFAAMRVGHAHRSVAVTNVNEHSSRSHLIFMLTVEQKDTLAQTIKVGKLHLVDLAGAESVAKSGVLGERLDEAKNINKSLSALGNVIHALTDKRAGGLVGHVPYRDSKLTRVLQESLGGNAKTSLIVTVSPVVYSLASTLTSLRFGCRAKLIRNTANVNEVLSAEQLQVLLKRRDDRCMRYRTRVAELEKVLRRAGVPVPPWPQERAPEEGSMTPEVPGQTVPGGQKPGSSPALKWTATRRREALEGSGPRLVTSASQASLKGVKAPPFARVRASTSTDTLRSDELRGPSSESFGPESSGPEEDARSRGLAAENARLRDEVRALQDAAGCAVAAAAEAAGCLESIRPRGPSKPLVFEPAPRSAVRPELAQHLAALVRELERHAPEDSGWRRTAAEMEALLAPSPTGASDVLAAWPAAKAAPVRDEKALRTARKVQNLSMGINGVEEMLSQILEVNQQLRSRCERQRQEMAAIQEADGASKRAAARRDRTRIRIPIRGGAGG